jgi:hypothetical protein
LLAILFDALDIEDCEVAAYKPHEDRAAEVAALIEGLANSEREGSQPSPTNYEIRFL